MKLKGITLAVAVAGLVSMFASTALAGENEKPGEEMVVKAAQAVKNAFPDAVVGKMATENEDGVNIVEVKFSVNGTKKEADVSLDGVLLAVEEKGDIANFPPAAAKALNDATKGMKAKHEISTTYAKVEKDASGQMTVVKLAQPAVEYEAEVKKGGKEGEFSVDATGKMLESPKWAAEGDGKDEKD